MDSKRFDALTRGFGVQRSRRDALKSFAAGLIGLGVAGSASAQVSIQRATCGQSCNDDRDCNAGLRCRSGDCLAIPDSRDPCDQDRDCNENYEICRNDRCVNESNCDRCRDNNDCANDEICRNGDCERRECNNNNDCPRRKRCRDGRCERR